MTGSQRTGCRCFGGGDMSEQDLESAGPVLKRFSKEELLDMARNFLQINLGSVQDMTPADKRAYHEMAGILMFYINYIWDLA
jgi:hypothetical protein